MGAMSSCDSGHTCNASQPDGNRKLARARDSDRMRMREQARMEAGSTRCLGHTKQVQQFSTLRIPWYIGAEFQLQPKQSLCHMSSSVEEFPAASSPRAELFLVAQAEKKASSAEEASLEKQKQASSQLPDACCVCTICFT